MVKRRSVTHAPSAVNGARLMDGSISWDDGIYALPGSPEAKVDTPLVGMNGNQPAGRDPRTIPATVLIDAGFEPVLSKAVRAKCLDCATTAKNVAECHLTHCALWPFRMGVSPFKAKKRLTDAQRDAARESARKARATLRGVGNLPDGDVPELVTGYAGLGDAAHAVNRYGQS